MRLNAAGDAVELAWKDEEGLCGLMAAPLEKEGTVFFLDRHHGLQALDLATGKIHWRDENTLTPADRNPQMSLVWMDETRDLAALLNADGELVMARLTAEARTELGRWQVSSRTWAHPAFVGNRIYVRGESELACWLLWPGDGSEVSVQ